ncbi:homoserine dehydrogenase [Candidatus Gottesmanbacteria bacterium]|nr:homoserine dehydrogenase [Candidatus Gottesmanbacteria bacterium]
MRIIKLIHLGVGRVGGELIRQIRSRHNYIKNNFHIKIRYCGLFNSKEGVFNKSGLSEKEIRNFPGILNTTIKAGIKVIDGSFILIDTSASSETYPILLEVLQRGGYVVLSNKKPLTKTQKEYNILNKIGKGRVFYETTVGAGLPIINTLQTLISSGDEIVSIEGCFSGTLGFLFSSLEDGMTFSKSVKLAQKKGYTEPDPRDDLGGLDVARKALILARLIGHSLELSDIKLQKLYPENLESISPEDFMSKMSLLDKEYKAKMAKAKKKGRTLRFIASLAQVGCQVGLSEVSQNSDIGLLRGPDNIISIKTKRYFDQPLVIKGPGAGAEVTAAGVFGDILEIAKNIKD